MGNCCSGDTVDVKGNIENKVDVDMHGKQLSEREIVLLVRVQAGIRGHLTRKKNRESLGRVLSSGLNSFTLDSPSRGGQGLNYYGASKDDTMQPQENNIEEKLMMQPEL